MGYKWIDGHRYEIWVPKTQPKLPTKKDGRGIGDGAGAGNVNTGPHKFDIPKKAPVN